MFFYGDNTLQGMLCERPLNVFAHQFGRMIAARLHLERMHTTARFREEFMGVLGHDLRSPLNTIVMSAQMLLRS